MNDTTASSLMSLPLPDLGALDLRVARFAVYYAPPAGSCWWHEGSRWLGRDAATGQGLPQPAVEALSKPLAALTTDPRRYGWHATLKAPMRLHGGATVDDLRLGLRQIASRHAAFSLPLRVDVLHVGKTAGGDEAGFVALRPLAAAAAATQLDVLAQDCVRSIDDLRAPPSDAEVARRNAMPLSARQRDMFARWGYPFVFDEFRFHLTLSDKVAPEDATAITEWWQPRVQALGPLPVDSFALFVQATPESPFRLVERFALGGQA